MRSDALDQAKHRVPRQMQPSKAFSELIRPCCHVMMVWIHCMTFDFCISDADCFKEAWLVLWHCFLYVSSQND